MESARKNEVSKSGIQRLIRNFAEEFIRFLKNSKYAVVLTGAGVSTDSGIPDFRSENGLYSKYNVNKVFDVDYFLRDPKYFYNFAKEEILKMLMAEPSATHYMLAKLEKESLIKAIITQNIDLLHQKAGSQNVIELHGNVSKAHCIQCKKEYDFIEILNGPQNTFECKTCGDLIKPDIVFFGESLPENELKKALYLVNSCDLIIVMGSSLVVHPAASLPIYATNKGAKFLIINRGKTALDSISTRKYDCNLNEFSKTVLNLLSQEG
ncbi:MAG: NAD-dependent deacetylase [Thermotogaceae bacterium]|jgi:NAD-dependent deacetylase|nr:NAD-dependent deacetylase [Thermotogaceae bacterium]MDN5337253.1 NAD-dependent deacetylase [Thermotogaceae bacterium]